jgi:ribonuclease P protein component
MTKRSTLGKTERLKSRKAIETLFEKGKSFTSAPFRVLQQRTDTGILRFGIGVSSRHFKRAVDRNLIKRRVREAYRLQNGELKQLLVARKTGMDVFFTYTGKEIADYALISAAVKKCLLKLMNQFNENSA